MKKSTANVQSLEDAKNNLLKTAAQIDFLAPVKKRPILSIGCAFFTGIICASLQKNIRNLPMLPLILDGADLVIQTLLDKKK